MFAVLQILHFSVIEEAWVSLYKFWSRLEFSYGSIRPEVIQSTVLSYMFRRASLRMDLKTLSDKPTGYYHLSLQSIYHCKALILRFRPAVLPMLSNFKVPVQHQSGRHPPTPTLVFVSGCFLLKGNFSSPQSPNARFKGKTEFLTIIFLGFHLTIYSTPMTCFMISCCINKTQTTKCQTFPSVVSPHKPIAFTITALKDFGLDCIQYIVLNSSLNLLIAFQKRRFSSIMCATHGVGQVNVC